MRNKFKRFLLKPILAGALSLAAVSAFSAETVEVYKSPTCGCCSKWVDHLRDHGFIVNTHDVGNKEARARAGITPSLGSCHTALVDGYAIEGHVPARDIKRLLRERPKALGLAVPDMPHGSPGMEGKRSEPYDVLLIKEKGDQRGDTKVYSSYNTSR